MMEGERERERERERDGLSQPVPASDVCACVFTGKVSD